MREPCYCGPTGDLEDREPVYLGDGQHGLRCPACGHLDGLSWLDRDAREGVLEESARRQLEDAARSPGWPSSPHGLLSSRQIAGSTFAGYLQLTKDSPCSRTL